MSDARVLVELGERYAALGLPVAARAAFERAAASGASDALPPRRLAELGLALGDAPAARQHALRVAALAPGPAARVLLGRAQLMSGELSAARMAFAQALEAAPTSPVRIRAHVGRGLVAVAEDDRAGAAAHALAGLDCLLGGTAIAGDLETELAAADEVCQLLCAAGVAVEAAARIDENPAAALHDVVAAALGVARLAAGDDGASERAIEDALARAVARWSASQHLRIRLLERRLGRRQRDPEIRAAARAELERLTVDHGAQLATPADLAFLARLWFVLAAALEDEPTEHARAADAYRQGLRLRPGHAAAANQLAVLALARGDLGGALADIEIALRIDAGHGLAWRSAARVIEASGPGAALAQVVERLLEAAEPGAGHAAGTAVPRLVRATAEVARGDILAGVYTRGHRVKNLVGVAAARARAARKLSEGELGGRLAELERELGALYEEWAVYLRSMESTGPRLEALPIAPLVAEVIAAASARAPVPIDCKLPPGLPDLRGDRMMLREALGNVVVNAVEACADSGGRVEISVRAIAAGSSTLIEISVADTGPGIAPSDLSHLFSPGFTTKPSGSGIGLAVAARAVEAHNGRILIDSEVGRGTLVTLLLPTDVAGVIALPLGGGT